MTAADGPGVVIVGAGQGGLQAAISLRQQGFAGALTLIGDEPGLPYQRPPLSKAYMASGDEAALVLRPEAFLRDRGIDHRPATTVTAIDRAARRVRLSGGGSLPYDRLILATGTRNLRPDLPGIDLAHDLRTLADARRLRPLLAAPRRIAVIGGGFIGLEFAAGARAAGHDVQVIEAAPRLMGRAVSAAMSGRFADLHRGWGTALHLGRAATAIDPAGVTLADGARIAADLVLLAVGVRPNTELAAAAGLEIENGIRTDAGLRTSDPAIFALGDCASFPDPFGQGRIRLESVQAATDHARLIAARIAGGGDDRYGALPWFWSDQGGHKLQIAGHAGPDTTEEIVAEGVVARLCGPAVVAVETLDRPGIHMKARRLLSGGAPIGTDRLREAAA